MITLKNNKISNIANTYKKKTPELKLLKPDLEHTLQDYEPDLKPTLADLKINSLKSQKYTEKN